VVELVFDMKNLVCFCVFLLAFWGSSVAAQVSFVIFDEGDDDKVNVSISADKANDHIKENRSVLTGDVVVVTEDIEFNSDRAIIQFLGDTNVLDTLTLVDNVYVELDRFRIHSNRGTYNHTENIVRLTGGVRYFSGGMEVTGDVFIYNTVTGEGVLESAAGSVDSG